MPLKEWVKPLPDGFEMLKAWWKQVFVQTAMTWILVSLAVIIIVFHCIGYKVP